MDDPLRAERLWIQSVPWDVEHPPVNTTKGQFGKLKNMFGSQQQPKDKKQEEARTAPADEKHQPVNPVRGQLGKLKNLYGKTK